MKISVLGSGGWGTTLAMLLFENGHDVTLWSYTQEESDQLKKTRVNPLLPKDVVLPMGLQYTANITCVKDCDIVVMATPSFAVRDTAKKIKTYLKDGAIVVSVSKGMEKDTFLRLSEVITQEIGEKYPVVVLTGPTHAEEVAKRMPTGCVAACEDIAIAETIQDVFINSYFRVYSNNDVIGVEVGAALKNVMALCAGCTVGMGYGDNTKAILMTRGITEIARLGVALGGKRETFAGLAGIGDLIVTCTSLNSRNNRAGILMGQGVPVKEAIAQIGAVVEGYYAVDSIYWLAKKMGVEMPITEAAYRTFYENADMKTVIRELMTREKRREIDHIDFP